MDRPYSQACENNKTPILTVLSKELMHSKHLLEIGSGTGQHAVYFAKYLKHLTWQPSDLIINHKGINAWIDSSPTKNIKKPIEIDLNTGWKQNSNIEPFDALFTANTLHIISWPLVIDFFQEVAKNFNSGATVCIYGPFKYQGKFTSESNANFDLWLKNRDIKSGIRDIEEILTLAESANLVLKNDYAMPAYNQLLVFTKQ
ncbi:DUF938 domain-containing protein [Litorilituus lipolyticus]|uniref:DUF938 domain-containing protein n=1 Tax=Litorilituus lipolyticus TaxID=2491017 RepID=A0A502KXF3_9GAMM|nr:DUF938 domain-containing protein [Litorilituus lipolyticus]TPH12937.1 DUF938 domain-containing protein [Litorilituus lipolyticus]